MDLLITPNSIIFLEQSDICHHQLPKIYCPECLVSTLPFYRDIRQTIKRFLPIQTVKYGLFKVATPRRISQKGNNMYYNSIYNHHDSKTRLSFNFMDCSEEFIFGFISAIRWCYMDLDRYYNNIYKGRYGDLHPMCYMQEIPDSEIVLVTRGFGEIFLVVKNVSEFGDGWTACKEVCDLLNAKRHYKWEPRMSNRTPKMLNVEIDRIRCKHLEQIKACNKDCYQLLVSCKGCDDMRFPEDIIIDCRNCKNLLTNASYERLCCLRCYCKSD